MKRKTLSVLVCLSLLCLSFGSSLAAETRAILTNAQAIALIRASLNNRENHARGLAFERLPTGKDEDPRYAEYHVTWRGADLGNGLIGSGLIGWIAVDLATGDVFNTTSDCGERDGARLRALQKKMRMALHLSDAGYEAMKTRGPFCTWMTDAQAKAIVTALFSEQQRKLPDFAVAQFPLGESGFLKFRVTWKGQRSPLLFGIDPSGADVFILGNRCAERSNAPVRDLQRKARASVHLTEQEYRAFRKEQLKCP